MKETKKMLKIIEDQYKIANKEYNESKRKQFRRECRRDFILGASIFMNIIILLIIIAGR